MDYLPGGGMGNVIGEGGITGVGGRLAGEGRALAQLRVLARRQDAPGCRTRPAAGAPAAQRRPDVLVRRRQRPHRVRLERLPPPRARALVVRPRRQLWVASLSGARRPTARAAWMKV